jgi:hypothetical protein
LGAGGAGKDSGQVGGGEKESEDSRDDEALESKPEENKGG